MIYMPTNGSEPKWFFPSIMGIVVIALMIMAFMAVDSVKTLNDAKSRYEHRQKFGEWCVRKHGNVVHNYLWYCEIGDDRIYLEDWQSGV